MLSYKDVADACGSSSVTAAGFIGKNCVFLLQGTHFATNSNGVYNTYTWLETPYSSTYPYSFSAKTGGSIVSSRTASDSGADQVKVVVEVDPTYVGS